jgi:Do/DeqQ family serine protease
LRLKAILFAAGLAAAAPTLAAGAADPPLSREPLVAPRRVPSSPSQVQLSFAPIVKATAPAVVNVFSRRTVRQQVDPFWQFFLGEGGAPRERVEQSLGSGAIVRADGIIVTNNHVIEGGEISVALADRREFPARVLLADPRADLAVLKIDVGNERLPVLPIADREDAEVGDLVLAIGDPFGVGQTVTNGIISALARSDVGITDYSYFIQTDAPINPGNSGGPLVDMNGNMIGLNTAILSRSGGSAGVGFAIPAPMVRRVVETALGGGSTVVRVWLGVHAQPVDAETARSIGLDRAQGLLISEIYPGGPGARAGLREGDLIVSLDGQPVNDAASLNYRIGTHRPGEAVRVGYRRDGAVREASLRAEAPPDGPRDRRTLTGRQPLGGATVSNLSPAAAEELGLDPFERGVVVVEVGDGYADNSGFRQGDVIREVNGRSVERVADLAAALAAAGRWHVVLSRGGREITADF